MMSISGLILVVFWLLGMILTVAVIVAIFQIRNAMKETVNTLHGIQQILLERKKD